MQPTVTILGNGGCLNEGLPYNSFMIGESLLVETPPDVMTSIGRLSKSIEKIATVFVSHLHGDHTFGLPFIVISSWYRARVAGTTASLVVYGPEGIQAQAELLTEAAFSVAHPCFAWLKEQVEFRELQEGSEVDLGGHTATCFEVSHPPPTYGFALGDHQNRPVFCYIPDTVWCHRVEEVLAVKPRRVLIDMNGVKGVHLSQDEVVEKAIPITGKSTVFYATHLAAEFESDHEMIRCTTQGDEIELDASGQGERE